MPDSRVVREKSSLSAKDQLLDKMHIIVVILVYV